jgi:uncharacterized membrane protein
MGSTAETVRTGLRWLLAVFYFLAGVAHLRSPAGFLTIMPDWVPYPNAVVALTGLAELAGAVGLLIPRIRRAAAIGLAAYAVCVYPANINHAINNLAMGGQTMSWWYHGPRLALQPVFVWLALWVGQVIDWPFGGKGNAR